MAIIATNTYIPKELIPADNYPARCFSMIEIGTVEEEFKGEKKIMKKVRLGWELPTMQKEFNKERGPEPMIIEKEFTLSMTEKANLRKALASWRGKDFSEDEAKAFDVTALIGAPCLLNIIHKKGVKDPTKTYEEIGSISKLPKEMAKSCPPQINKSKVLQYSDFDWDLYNSLPDFIKNKIKTSLEFTALQTPASTHIGNGQAKGIGAEDETDDLPF